MIWNKSAGVCLIKRRNMHEQFYVFCFNDFLCPRKTICTTKNYFGFDIDINVSVLMRFEKQIGMLNF